MEKTLEEVIHNEDALINKALIECRKIFEKNLEIEVGDISKCDYTTYYEYKPNLNITMRCLYLKEEEILDQWILAEPKLEKATSKEEAWKNIGLHLKYDMKNSIEENLSEDDVESYLKGDIKDFICYLMIHGDDE